LPNRVRRMQDLSLHILDIVENSIAAGATKIEINIDENIKKNRLVLAIKDNGKGMDKKTLTMVLDPFYTTKKTRRIGLGLSMLAQATKEAEGKFDIKSEKKKGTAVTAQFVHNHIDRKPIGNMTETITDLIATNGSEIDFIYKHRKNRKVLVFDTRTLKKELKDISITDPEILSYLKKEIKKQLSSIGVRT